MSGPNDWNPDDGPPPTEEELRDASALADALSVAVGPTRPEGAKAEPAPKAPVSLDNIALVETAMRAHATAHPPERLQVDRAVKSAVDHAVSSRARGAITSRWYVRLTAVAAALVVGVTGARALSPKATRSINVTPISRSTDDVFSRAIENDPGSDPISRIDDVRMRSFRANVFARGGRTR